MTSMVYGHCTKNCKLTIIKYKSDIIVVTVIVLDQRCSNKQGVIHQRLSIISDHANKLKLLFQINNSA